VRKAEADFRLAEKLVRESDPAHDHVCFLSQQCAEKYLKALLEELSLTVPRTHILADLLTLLLPHLPSLRSLRRGLKFLTRFAVGPRYPGYRAKKRQAVSAFRWACKVRDTLRLLLGLRMAR
jgi:HEPN domain-containing protein